MSAPKMKAGWLKKKSRGGLIKNWQRRYFVLNDGKISYFEKRAESPPYGEGFKGSMPITATTVCVWASDEKGADAGNHEEARRRLYIKDSASKDEKDMLVETEDDLDAREWKEAIGKHIEHAINGGGDDSSNGYGRGTVSGGSPDILKTVVPTPGFVLKTRRTGANGAQKVFINICHDRNVPTANAFKGSARWPFMLASTARSYADKDGSEYIVYDIVVNSQVMKDCDETVDESHTLRDMVCNKSLRRLAKQFGEELEKDYTVPKSNKGFKGDCKELPPILLNSDDVTSARRSSIAKGIIGVLAPTSGGLGKRTVSLEGQPNTSGSDAAGSPSPTGRGAGFRANSRSPTTTTATDTRNGTVRPSPSGGNGNGSGSSGSSGSSSRQGSDANEASSSSRGRTGSTLNNPKKIALVRRKIPYVVVASSGVTLRSDPSQFCKDASTSRGVTMPQGETLSVVGRIEHPEIHDSFLLRCVGVNDKDGWISEYVGSNITKPAVLPQTDDKIVGTRIVRWNLAPAKEAGFFSFGKSDRQFRLVMHFELQYPRDHVIHISRDIDDVLHMREAILNTNLSKKLSFVSFPLAYTELDGTDAMVGDVQALLTFMDVLVEWISHIVRKSEFHRVDEVTKFIKPTEEDRQHMDNDLMASGGFGGAYPNEMFWEGPNSLA